MDFLPIFVNIRNQPCLVVGGGEVAARKVALLRKAQAQVTVVSPELGRELSEMADKGEIRHVARNFEDADIEQPVLVIAATDQREVNEKVSALGKARGIPVNVVDNPPLCSFIMPSIVDRSPVQIAISTGGASPVLARMIRTKLEGVFQQPMVGWQRWLTVFVKRSKPNFPMSRNVVLSGKPYWKVQ